ncbi:MAG: hypothetical protein WAW41_02075, partial [Methylobacter sp.]
IYNIAAPFKIDLVAYPQVIFPPNSDFIGEYTKISEITEIFEQWIKRECPTLNRIGYGVILNQETSNRKSSYETLAHYLPCIEFNVDNWSDFLFQVNNMSASMQKEGLKINQVSKWNAIRKNTALLELSGANIIQERYFCRLELDINTSHEHQEVFTTREILDVFNELKTIAHRYTQDGVTQ